MAEELSGANSPFSLTFTFRQSLLAQGTQAVIQDAFGNAIPTYRMKGPLILNRLSVTGSLAA